MSKYFLIEICFSVGTILLLFYQLFSDYFSLQAQLNFFFVTGIIFGLPHGALDYEVAKHLGLVNKTISKVYFFSGYLLIAALNYLLWIVEPMLGFAIFFLLSAYHFGEDWVDSESHIFERMIYGVGFLTLPAVFNSADLLIIFAPLLPNLELSSLIQVMKWCGFMSITAIFFISISDYLRGRGIWNFFLSIIFLLSGLFLPPILFLILIFCVLHSSLHSLSLFILLQYPSLIAMIKKQIPIMGATLILLIFLLLGKNMSVMSEDLFASLVILIACLTTPHMILIEYLHRFHKLSPK